MSDTEHTIQVRNTHGLGTKVQSVHSVQSVQFVHLVQFFQFICLFIALAAAANGQDKLVLLSPHWEGIRYEFAEAFSARYKAETGRALEFQWLEIGGGASDQMRFIRSEFKAKPGGIGIDLFFGGGVDPYQTLKADGVLEAYRVPDEILRGVAPSIGGQPLYDPDYTWYAPTMAGFGIIYNKVALRRLGLPEPKTWEDLGRPEFFSWVGSADPRKSGSVHMAYEIMLQAYGWERGWQIITALGANVRAFPSSASQTPRDAAVGEVATGLCIDFYAWRQAAESGADLIGFVYPAGLTVINGDGVGILKGAPHRDIARRFLDFLMSEDGQKLFLLKQGEPGGPRKYELGKFSVRPDLYAKSKNHAVIEVNPFDWKWNLKYDAAKGSARMTLVDDLIGAMVIDPKERLNNAWTQAIANKKAESKLSRLAHPPVTEAEAMTIAKSGRWKDDPEFRSQTLKQWAEFASAKYGPMPASNQFLRNIPALAALATVIGASVYMRRRSAMRRGVGKFAAKPAL